MWRLTRAALLCALGWSALVVVGAYTAPVYSGTTTTARADSGGSPPVISATTTSATLVEVNGDRVVLVALVPLVVSVVVAALLWRQPAARAARVVAWLLVVALGGLALLAMMSIGVFLVPAVLASFVACAAASTISAEASATHHPAG